MQPRLLYGSVGPVAYFATSGALAIAGAVGMWLVLHGAVGAREPTALSAEGQPLTQ